MNRTSTYLGPGLDIEHEGLTLFERLGRRIIEPKVDGMWAELIVGNLNRGRPHQLTSRDGNTDPISGSNLGDVHLQPIPLPEGSVLIGELEAKTEWATEQKELRGFRRLHLFDILKVAGLKPLIYGDKRLFQRRIRLNQLLESMNCHKDESRFVKVDFKEVDFEHYYHKWIKEGYEGAVIKPIDSLYTTHRSDGKTKEWIRCKRWITMDYVLWVIEMSPGGKYIDPEPTGAWSLYKNGKLERVMKAAPPDQSLLRHENIGKLVVEFRGWARFRSGALRHAQAVRVRTDKSPRMCTL